VGSGLHTLAAVREVGRAAFLLTTPDSRVLIDCGEKPDNASATPYLYVPEIHPLTQLDAVVLTHAHLDHCALIPCSTSTVTKGRSIRPRQPGTSPQCSSWITWMSSTRKAGRSPTAQTKVKTYIRHSITLNYGSVTDIAPDIKLTFHNAGHILGSAIAHFHVGDGLYNIAFTGDFNYSKSRLFNPAVNQFPRLETLLWRARTAARTISSPPAPMRNRNFTRPSTRCSRGAAR